MQGHSGEGCGVTGVWGHGGRVYRIRGLRYAGSPVRSYGGEGSQGEGCGVTRGAVCAGGRVQG